jgi:hypothetical protein
LRDAVRSIPIILVLCLAFEGAAAAAPGACPLTDAQGSCVEACELRAGPEARASDLFLTKLRNLAATGRHVGNKPGAAVATAVSQFRVASVPFKKDAAGRWRQNGLWAGPCAGLSFVFQASAVDNKNPSNVVDLYELHYASDAAARRVAALLGTSWDWNGHPFIAIQRGTNVIVAEGRYGAWSALETVGAHFGGAVYPRGAPIALRVCDKKSRQPPIFQGDGLTVHVLGFAPSGELAWLEGRGAPDGPTAWSMHVSNLVNDREVAARSYRAVGPTADAFCAEHRADAGALLSEYGVTGGEVVTFDKPTIDGTPVSVLIQGGSSGKQIVMEGPAGKKVLGRVPAGAVSAKPLGFIRSPFEERVAVLVMVKDGASGRPGLRVLGGRLDKRWMPRQ